jgi:hypothetical protein
VGAEDTIPFFGDPTIKAQSELTAGYIEKYTGTKTTIKTHTHALKLGTYVFGFNETDKNGMPLYGFTWQMDHRFIKINGEDVPYLFTRVGDILEPKNTNSNSVTNRMPDIILYP